MTTATATANTFAGLTADEWTEKAKACTRESYDSFERCDTDGFLSQWANDTMASRYRECARIAEAGGVLKQIALFKDGVYVSEARNVKGRYGYVWVFDDEDGNAVWLNESKDRDASKRRDYFVKKHPGFTVGWATFEARLESRTGKVFAARDALVSIETADDTDFGEEFNNAY